MNKNSFSKLVWKSLLTSWGPATAIVAIVAMFVGWFSAPASDTVQLRWLLVIVIFFLFLSAFLGKLSWLAYDEIKIVPPKVKRAHVPTGAYEGSIAMLLLDPTPNLAYEALVSIYYLENEFEKLAGVGKVVNVQNNGKVQVLVLTDYESNGKLGTITQNKPDDLNSLILKTSIPSLVIEAQFNG